MKPSVENLGTHESANQESPSKTGKREPLQKPETAKIENPGRNAKENRKMVIK
jgi:hypothetical protein